MFRKLENMLKLIIMLSERKILDNITFGKSEGRKMLRFPFHILIICIAYGYWPLGQASQGKCTKTGSLGSQAVDCCAWQIEACPGQWATTGNSES